MKYEDKAGAKECLKWIQSSKTPIEPLLESPSRSYFQYVGITTDYLIRYIANNNFFDFSSVERSIRIPIGSEGGIESTAFCEYILFEKIARIYLDGRPVDELAIYSATALAMAISLYRSGRLPRLFWQEISYEKKKSIGNLRCGSDADERTVMWLFDEYCFEKLNWDLYVQDVLAITRIFIDSSNNHDGELRHSKFTVNGKALANQGLVDGADFDCVIQQNEKKILTDIKATVKPLVMEYLRQLIGYVLLHDESLDAFEISDVGIYFSRTGEFRYLPVEVLIQKCLPSFKSIAEAKEAFRREVRYW